MTYHWLPYGNLAAEVHGPDGRVCIVGLPAEMRLASIREGAYQWAGRPDAAGREEARLLARREANHAWAERIARALNAQEGL